MKVARPPRQGAYATASTSAFVLDGVARPGAGLFLAINAAMLTAIGIITMAVAVLLIHIPMKAVTRSSPASRLPRFQPA
jgi:hypothetical protein